MSARDEAVWFPSAVDRWLAVVLAIAPLMVAVATIAEAVAGSTTDLWIGAAACAFIGAIYGLLIFPMRYGISADRLIVRHGVVRQRVRLADITEVQPSRNPLSSPALSLNRLHVRFGSGFFRSVLISPADRAGFLALLAERAGLERDGETLRRPPAGAA